MNRSYACSCAVPYMLNGAPAPKKPLNVYSGVLMGMSFLVKKKKGKTKSKHGYKVVYGSSSHKPEYGSVNEIGKRKNRQQGINEYDESTSPWTYFLHIRGH
jgi:hypothetical protein